MTLLRRCRALPLLLSLVATAGCEKSGATRAPASGVKFGSEPASVGEVVNVDSKTTMSIEFTHLGPGGYGPVTIQFEFANTRSDEVREVKDGLPTMVVAKYKRAREYWGGTEGSGDEPLDMAGEAFVIKGDGDFEYAERADGSNISSSWIDGQLERDFELIGSPGQLRAQMRGKSIGKGERIEITPGEVAAAFPDTSADLLTLELAGLDSRCGREVAVFDASVELTVWFRRSGARAALEGKAMFDVATGAPVELDLAGPVKMVDGNGRVGDNAAVKGKGKAALKATYQPNSC